MPYSITTEDGITVDNIPDHLQPDAPELKQRVAEVRWVRDHEHGVDVGTEKHAGTGGYWGTLAAIALGLLCLWFLFQRWFWVLALGLASITALFTMLACIIHFQILGAVGMFFVTSVTWALCKSVADGPSPQ